MSVKSMGIVEEEGTKTHFGVPEKITREYPY